jgi:hypothetical protein
LQCKQRRDQPVKSQKTFCTKDCAEGSLQPRTMKLCSSSLKAWTAFHRSDDYSSAMVVEEGDSVQARISNSDTRN